MLIKGLFIVTNLIIYKPGVRGLSPRGHERRAQSKPSQPESHAQPNILSASHAEEEAREELNVCT